MCSPLDLALLGVCDACAKGHFARIPTRSPGIPTQSTLPVHFVSRFATVQHVRSSHTVPVHLPRTPVVTPDVRPHEPAPTPLMQALREVLPAVASKKVGKGGYLVLRPDSGDPMEAVLMVGVPSGGGAAGADVPLPCQCLMAGCSPADINLMPCGTVPGALSREGA